MGTMCSQPPKPVQRTVTFLPNSIPESRQYKAVEAESIRLCDVTAYKKDRNIYEFTMSIRNEMEDIREQIPILNQMVHCIGCENYELTVESRMIIDIFDRKLESTMIEVKNGRTLREFSLKVVPFKSYTSAKFKKALHQLSYTVVKLMDCFAYGFNPDQQAFAFLFDKCSTNLANVAEYRKFANTPWTFKEKIKIISEVFESYENLHNRNIIHRDIRPSNIFYVPSVGKFVLGNFSKSRVLRQTAPSDLMSVCGVPQFSCEEMQNLMSQGEHIGYYDGLRQDYAGLKSILSIVETCQIYDRNPVFMEQQLSQLNRMLNGNVNYRNIMAYLQELVSKEGVNRDAEIGDREIADSCSFLLAHTHKAQIESYVFEVYGYLGYHKNYSDKAHKMMTLNNETGREHENAHVLGRLGDFYQEKGAKGTEYYYNAFVLFIMRADNQLRYGYPERAENQLHSAQQTYFKFNKVIESEMPRIQIKRVSSLIELANGSIPASKTSINENLVAAAKANLPVQKQCKILLAYGKIYGVMPETREEAIRKLSTGLTICENSAIFESPSSCRVMKSKFLRELGALHSDKLKPYMFTKKTNATTEEEEQIKAQAETYLRSALEIQERETVDDLQVADTSEELGVFYYQQKNFHEAKRYLDAAKIRLAHIKELVNPKRQLAVVYMLGGCNYYLNQFNEAKMNYMTCLATLERMPKTEENQILAYNMEGNLGLSLLKMGNQAGHEKVANSLAQLKHLKGENSFDYASLHNNYLALNQS